MSRKLIGIIPLVMTEAIIQLLFFWLAPNTSNRWVVYAFISIMTIFHLAFSTLLGSRTGVRRGAATVVSGSIIQALILVAAVGLLAFNVNIRNTVFMLMILVVLYFADLFTFIFLLERPLACSQMDDVDREMYGKLEKTLSENARQSRERILRDNNRNMDTDSNNNGHQQVARHSQTSRPTPPPLPVRK